MAMFRGQINVIELIKPITLIIQSVPIGQENFSPYPLPDIPEWSSELWSRSLCHHDFLLPCWRQWIMAATCLMFQLCLMFHSHIMWGMLWRKEWSYSSWSASYGEFIEQTVTETCTFQHTWKFPMTSVLWQLFIPFYIIQCVRGPNPISIWRLLSEDATASSSLSRQGSFWPQQHVIQAICGSSINVQYVGPCQGFAFPHNSP